MAAMHWAVNWFDEWCWNWKLHSLATTCKVAQTIGQQLERRLYQITCAQKLLAIVLYQESECNGCVQETRSKHLKELSVERMHTHVCAWNIDPNNDGKDWARHQGYQHVRAARRRWAITPLVEPSQETKDYLRSYHLSKGLDCHSGAMDACTNRCQIQEQEQALLCLLMDTRSQKHLPIGLYSQSDTSLMKFRLIIGFS